MPNPKEAVLDSVACARRDGRVFTIEPPMTGREIRQLESRCGGAIAPPIRNLVEYTAGFSFGELSVDFRGALPFEFDGMFACAVPIATDGSGNFWVVDVTSGGHWGAVFFVSHDPPVAVLQARDLGGFIAQAFEAREPERLVGDAVVRIERDDPYTATRAQALASPDPALRLFAGQLTDDFRIGDLRDAGRGAGFVWGANGAQTDIRRSGDDLLFGIEQRKQGLLGRLFSK